jgi:hypothetical protein
MAKVESCPQCTGDHGDRRSPSKVKVCKEKYFKQRDIDVEAAAREAAFMQLQRVAGPSRLLPSRRGTARSDSSSSASTSLAMPPPIEQTHEDDREPGDLNELAAQQAPRPKRRSGRKPKRRASSSASSPTCDADNKDIDCSDDDEVGEFSS